MIDQDTISSPIGVAISLVWANASRDSLEYFSMVGKDGKYVMEGTIVVVQDLVPARVSYHIRCDGHWFTEFLHLRLEREGKETRLNLNVNKERVWHNDGSVVSFAQGWLDVDLEISPSTNTIPIRRLDLKVGESRTVDAIWVRFPSLEIEPLRQIYTRLDENHFVYEAPQLSFEAILEVDKSGLIVNYGNLWERISSTQ